MAQLALGSWVAEGLFVVPYLIPGSQALYWWTLAAVVLVSISADAGHGGLVTFLF